MGANVYPEMDADKLGCTTLWNVNAQLFHILGQAVTLAASNDAGQSDGKQTQTFPGGPPASES
jgi:hypothetical protein